MSFGYDTNDSFVESDNGKQWFNEVKLMLLDWYDVDDEQELNDAVGDTDSEQEELDGSSESGSEESSSEKDIAQEVNQSCEDSIEDNLNEEIDPEHITEEDYYGGHEIDFVGDPDYDEYLAQNRDLPDEIELTDDNFEEMIRRYVLGIRNTHAGVNRNSLHDEDFEINEDHDHHLEESLNSAGYDNDDSFVSQHDDILDPSSEEEKGADLSKLKETDYKLQDSKDPKTGEAKLEKANCAICMEDIIPGNKIILLACGHMFHGPCIINWVKDKNSCPYCRKTVTSSK
jgi:hypothetical protein